MNQNRINEAARCFLRLALAAGFLSAVADRFGLWGSPGAPHVAWGEWQPFIAYVAKLNWFVPASVVPTLAWIATVAELVLGIGLLLGWRLRWFALASGILLSLFAITMTLALGIKAALDFSVFAAAAGAFLLAAVSPRRNSSPRLQSVNLGTPS